MKNVIIIAYHFPPVKVSSGLQRTLSFSKYLLDHGWHAEILTVNPRAYEATSTDQLRDIPEQVTVNRAFALDTAKHLSFRGRYPGVLAMPDRWISWWLGALWSGLRVIRRVRPEVLWSTYPIATAHLVGLTLHKISNIPWVADFRDSMTEDEYPADPTRRKIFLKIEKATMYSCSKAVFTTPGAIRMYKERYPDIPDNKYALIPNGYDESIFTDVESTLPSERLGRDDNKILLVHSGVIYPSERDPRPLFSALAKLKGEGYINPNNLKVVLRATGHDHIYQPIIDQLELAGIVTLQPGIEYRDALQEMLLADGLLLLQASNCNHQIPAKLYEYLRARKPIFALTDIKGDTAATLINAGIDTIAPLDDMEAIFLKLRDFLIQIRTGTAIIADENAIKNASRAASSEQLAEIFNSLSAA